MVLWLPMGQKNMAAMEFECKCFGLSPLPVTVTTRIITFLVGDPYRPSFATVTERGDNPTNVDITLLKTNMETYKMEVW